LPGAQRAFESGWSDEYDGGHGGQHNENEKPPEFPQGVIACRTPCALEPDVSEANSFSQTGGAGFSLAAGLSRVRDPLALRPAVAGGLPCCRVI